ncbi:hypothetical protein [Microbacterium sp. 77mftsu3.1]|uniref:hypothetical protein n=1 Tax=Microbacterium sp. 77mftsu3.1 TaxID=1761802 RepID=UPI000377426A|nr:hypothetical protein [Microbacterium sp. 77mftsu3.1]SDH35518.1 hypothetical protein SAMN04488590_3114 [Microbacterium sp. 77mftsu3.1]
MTDISAVDKAARESARQKSGEFGKQTHSAPEATLTAEAPTKSAREQRIEDGKQRFKGIHRQWLAAQRDLAAEFAGQAFETAPIDADKIVFTGGGGYDSMSYLGMYDADGEWVHREGLDYRDLAEWADADAKSAGLVKHGTRYELRVGKDATRERIGALQYEWRKGVTGRSSASIGDDIDAAATRYLNQVAAEQGWDSIQLDWEDEGREGLVAKKITAGGKTYRAGSGDLDDHEALWAATQFARPTDRMTRTDGVAPFTLTFER